MLSNTATTQDQTQGFELPPPYIYPMLQCMKGLS